MRGRRKKRGAHITKVEGSFPRQRLFDNLLVTAHFQTLLYSGWQLLKAILLSCADAGRMYVTMQPTVMTSMKICQGD